MGGGAYLMSQMNWMDTSVLLGSSFGIMAVVEQDLIIGELI